MVALFGFDRFLKEFIVKVHGYQSTYLEETLFTKLFLIQSLLFTFNEKLTMIFPGFLKKIEKTFEELLGNQGLPQTPAGKPSI